MSDRKQSPDFLVIGAQKCGTSWLHRCLSQHPALWMPPHKELEFFSYDAHLSEPGLVGYQQAFGPAQGRLAGEATASYFWTGSASPWCQQPTGFNADIPGTVRQLLGTSLKIILCLRDPVERALSAWAHYVVHDELDPSMPFRQAGRYGGIVDMGFYSRHLARWRSHFSEDQILMLSLDHDIKHEPRRTLVRCFEHLGVDVDSPIDESTSEPVFPGLTRQRGVNGEVHIPLPDGGALHATQEDLAWLRALYAEDSAALAKAAGPVFDYSLARD